MTKCPHCRRKLDTLIGVLIVEQIHTVYLERGELESKHEEDHLIDAEYCCPECRYVICRNDSDVIKFLGGDT